MFTPVQKAKPLVSGHDLIRELGLRPGPEFKRLLSAVEEAQMEGRVHSKAEGLQLVREKATLDSATKS